MSELKTKRPEEPFAFWEFDSAHPSKPIWFHEIDEGSWEYGDPYCLIEYEDGSVATGHDQMGRWA